MNALDVCGCPRVPWLCGCGYGRLAIPECKVPESCPSCGMETPGDPPLYCPWEGLDQDAVSDALTGADRQ